MLNVARKLQSRRLEFPTKKWGRGGSLARKFHSRSKFSISLDISKCFDLWVLWVRGRRTPNSPLVLFRPENGLFRLPKHYFFEGILAKLK